MKQRTSGSVGSVIALSLALFGTPIPPANATDCLKYEPSSVNLTGTISVRHAFGSPGYGEDTKHDTRESYLVLTLDRPICVDGVPNDDMNSESETQMKALQMVYFGEYPFKREWLKQHVAVTGTLFHALTGHHRTPVLIQVTKTERVPRMGN